MTNATTPTPGTQIRVKCAKAMGYKLIKWTRGQYSYSRWIPPGASCENPEDPRSHQGVELPAFDTHWDGAAELLVQALRKEGWRWEAQDDNGGVFFCFSKYGTATGNVKHGRTANKLPLAIATAFLATKGLEPC